MAKRDPLGIVGQHVMRRTRAPDGHGFHDVVEHGWITRYDERFDQYTMFVPHKGADLLLRGEIVQCMTTEELLLCRDDQTAFPPPLEDHASRYVGVPIVRNGMTGRVICFLPFEGLYKVAYPDNSSDEVTENEIINSLIDVVTTAQASLDNEERQRKRVKVESQVDVVSVRASRNGKRGSSSDSIRRSDSSSGISDSRSSRRDSGRRTESATTSSNVVSKVEVMSPVAVVAVSPPVVPVMTLPSVAPVHHQPDVEEEVGSSTAPINILELLPTEPAVASTAMPLAEVEETTTASPMVVTLEEMAPIEEDADVSTGINVDDGGPGSDVEILPYEDSPTTVISRPAFYVIDKPPHEATKPFERRSQAYEYLRKELLNVLDRRESGTSKSVIQYDVLRNPDIKDRDSLRRFVEAKGLIVVNALISLYMDEESPQYDNLLAMLKILAMLPNPTEQQVIESSIGKTVGRITKARALDAKPLPKSVTHLARWIKTKWIEAIKRTPVQSKEARSSNKRAAPQNKMGRPSKQLQSHRDATMIYEHDQVPIPRLKRRVAPASTPVVPDSSSATARSTDILGSALGGASQTDTQTGGVRKTNLKPDWMRRTESLSRTRFTVHIDSKAEYDHYKRDHDSRARFRLPASSNENESTSGGNLGVYGRTQKLAFGDQWSVCEFFRDTAPSFIHPDLSKLPKGRQIGSSAPPRSILRKQSKYTNALASF